MAVLKYSRQREAIKNYLQGREDHPTADMVYAGIREDSVNARWADGEIEECRMLFYGICSDCKKMKN